jgi:putative membrane protein
VRFDLVPGPVKMVGRDLPAEDAVELLTRLRQRALPTGRSR